MHICKHDWKNAVDITKRTGSTLKHQENAYNIKRYDTNSEIKESNNEQLHNIHIHRRNSKVSLQLTLPHTLDHGAKVPLKIQVTTPFITLCKNCLMCWLYYQLTQSFVNMLMSALKTVVISRFMTSFRKYSICPSNYHVSLL